MFYIFFEGVLIPMFLIIGVWGGPRRIYSAFKFFLYTLLGSVLMLAMLLSQKLRGMTVYRTLFYLPTFVYGVALLALIGRLEWFLWPCAIGSILYAVVLALLLYLTPRAA